MSHQLLDMGFLSCKLFVNKHGESWQKMWKNTLPIHFTMSVKPTRMEPKPASHMWSLKPPHVQIFTVRLVGTRSFLASSLWPSRDYLVWILPSKYLNQAQLKQTPKFPSIKLMIFDVPSLFTSSKWFQRRFWWAFCSKYPSIKLQHHALEGLRGGWHQGSPLVVVWSDWILWVFFDMFDIQQGERSHKDDT